MADEVLSQFKKAEEKAEAKATKRMRVGIIGCGGIAGAHIGSYKRMDDVDIIAGCDIIPGKAEQFFKRHEVEVAPEHCYTDCVEMLEKEQLDAVSVCTYNRSHAKCAIAALDHGVPVLCEKPMSVTLDEAIEMMRAEKRSGKILTIGFQPRFDPSMRQVCDIVRSGVLGKVYYIQTGGGRRRGIPCSTFIEDSTAGVGALGDIGCYSLDCVLNPLGYPKPLTVSGYTSDFFGKAPDYLSERDRARFSVDDFAAAFVRLEGDIILDFRISWAMNMNTPGDTLILGTEAGLRIPSTDCWNGSIGGPMTIYRTVSGNDVETKVPMSTEKSDCFYKKCRSFLDAVRDGGAAPVPTSQIVYNQAIIDGIARSAKLGKEIKIEIPEI